MTRKLILKLHCDLTYWDRMWKWAIAAYPRPKYDLRVDTWGKVYVFKCEGTTL